jgi:antitoxin component of RelBE/YafQ-DinJ toxin-antitoxin module
MKTTRTVDMQCQINLNWVIRSTEIPIDTPDNKIDEVALAAMEKQLREEYKYEHATYYEAVVKFIGVYNVPTVDTVQQEDDE